MTSIRRLGAPGATLLVALAVCALLMFFPMAPAFAQGTPPPSGGGGAGFGDFLWNSFYGNEQSMRVLYDKNYADLKSMGCWGCTIFDTFAGSVFSAGHSVAVSSGEALTSVIVAVASLFSLVYIGSSFVSGDASDLLNRWKVFWRLMIAVAIGSAWLTAGNSFDNTWGAVYGPLLRIPMAAANAVPQQGPMGDACAGGVSPANAPPGSAAIITDMRKVVCGGHNTTIKGIAFGLALSNTGEGIVGSFVNLIVGVLIMIIFTWVAISFPLRFIDVLLRLTVVGIATPILVVCAVFKPTRGYVQIGISNVLHAGCLFAFTSIMFNLGGKFFDDAVQTRITSLNQVDNSVVLSQSIVLVGAGVIFAAMLRMAPALASEFSQFRGQSGGVGDAATSFTSSVVTMPVKGAAAVVAAKTGGSIAGKAAGSAMGRSGGGVAGSLGKGVSDGS